MYIRVMSKQLERDMFGYQLVAPYYTAAFNVVDSVQLCDNWNSDGPISGVTVFTDGSVVNGAVSFGACAAVLFPAVDGDEKYVQSRAVSKKVSIYHCEVEGIVLGLSMIVDYFCKLDNRVNLNNCFSVQ